MPYRVIIDDNFHYMDESERTPAGTFETLEEAVVACERITDDCLKHLHQPGMSADELLALYVQFGDDPWISGSQRVEFSARAYAKRRCVDLCTAKNDQQ